MIIPTYRYNRNNLTKEQKDFLVKIIPLAHKIQEWTYEKAAFANLKCPRGVLASITIADAVLNSGWGEHPISKPEFGNKYSNNIFLKEVDVNWQGKSHLFENKKYCAYKDWLEVAVDISDSYVFKNVYIYVLKADTLDKQLINLSILKDNPLDYRRRRTELIQHYYLSEFDL